MKWRTLVTVGFILILISSCKDNSTLPEPLKEYTSSISGKVILQNQTEYSNALVYIDRLYRGVSTDSSGNYTLQFTKDDSVYDGIHKLYYFLNDYDMDSASICLSGGKVKLNMLDVDAEGNLPTKEMKQILLVEGWTDKTEYKIGDTLTFTARFTNTTNNVIYLLITSIFNQLGSVSLYNDKYMPLHLSPCDPVMIDKSIYLYSGYYEGKVKYKIPDRYCCVNGESLLPDKYIITTGFFINGRLKSQFQDTFSKYILLEWWKICRGSSPKYDRFPNKYKFPIIKLIEQ